MVSSERRARLRAAGPVAGVGLAAVLLACNADTPPDTDEAIGEVEPDVDSGTTDEVDITEHAERQDHGSEDDKGQTLAITICEEALQQDYTLDARAVVSALVREADTDLTERELRGLVNDLCHRDIQALGTGSPPEPEPEDEPTPALDIQFVTGTGVTEGAREAVAEGLAHAAVFVEDLTGHRTEDFTVFLYTDREELLDRWMSHRGRPAHLRDRERERWTTPGGRAGDGFIFWLDSDYLTEASPDISPGAQRLLTHEYVHVVQHRHGPSGPRVGDHAVPRIGPVWLTEGVAEYLARRHFAAVLTPRHEEDPYDRVFRMQAEVAGSVEGELRTLETRAGVEQSFPYTGHTYALSSIAAQQLAQHAGEAALLDYYAALGETGNWRSSFESTFGLTIEEFYEKFDDPRPNL